MVPLSHYTKVLIVENDLHLALKLELQLRKLGYQVLGRLDYAQDCFSTIRHIMPDLLFINWELVQSFKLNSLWSKLTHQLNIPIVYLGIKERMLSKTFSNNLQDYYLPKDNFTKHLKKIHATIQSLIQHSEALNDTVIEKKQNAFSKDFLFLKKNGIHYKVSKQDIVYISSQDNYCKIYVEDAKTFLSRTTISQMERLLPPPHFMRIHRQHIICLKHIEMLDLNNNTVRVKGQLLNVSRSKRKTLANICNLSK